MMDSIPATEQLPWALCTAFKPVEEGPAGAAGAPYYQSTGWKKNKLKVHFMNEVPSGWRLTKEKVLEWANRWSDPRLKGIVPEFVIEEDIDQSDVRIMFSTRECCMCACPLCVSHMIRVVVMIRYSRSLHSAIIRINLVCSRHTHAPAREQIDVALKLI